MASVSAKGELRIYAKTLSEDVAERYVEKMGYLGGIDPYTVNIKDCTQDIDDFPKIHYIDIINYFKYCKSPYTEQELRVIKSTEGFKFFLNGWVRELAVKKINNVILILGKVLHSQSVKEKPLVPWVLSKNDGEVLCAHCTCVAGLSESCTHVGALLFAIERSVRDYEPISVTGKKAYWKAPSEHVGEQKQIHDVDFQSTKRKWEQYSDDTKFTVSEVSVSEPNKEEQEQFLKQLSESVESAVLKVKGPFCFMKQQEEKEESYNYLTALFNEEHLDKSLATLRNIAKDIDLSLSVERCNIIESVTLESPSPKWFGYRS